MEEECNRGLELEGNLRTSGSLHAASSSFNAGIFQVCHVCASFQCSPQTGRGNVTSLLKSSQAAEKSHASTAGRRPARAFPPKQLQPQACRRFTSTSNVLESRLVSWTRTLEVTDEEHDE